MSNKMKIDPPDLAEAKKAFIKEADIKITPIKIETEESKEQNIILPWEEEWVNERVTKGFNLRLSEPELLKMQYVAKHIYHTSLNLFIKEIVMEEVEKQLKEI